MIILIWVFILSNCQEIINTYPHKQNYTQMDKNTTFQLQFDDHSVFYLCELYLLNNNENKSLYFMYKEQYAASYKDQYLLDYDQIDVNGFAQQKDYYNIIIHNTINNNSKYITILTDKTTYYELNIQAYDVYPCPKQCSNNGYCMILNDLRGQCKCDSGWIDEDCSMPAQLLIENQNNQMKQQIVYYNGISVEKLMQLTITSEIDQDINIYVQTRVQRVFYPNKNNAENIYQVNEKQPITIFYRDTFPNTLIISVNQQDVDKLSVYLNEYNSQNNQISIELEKQSNKMLILIIIILFTIIGLISIYYLYRYLNKSTVRQQKQQQISQFDQVILPTFNISILQCEMCSKEIQDKEIVLSCNHHFHIHCLNGKNKQCPICISNMCELVD